MLAPLAVDFGQGNGHWPVFATSAAITIISGGFLALASSNGTHIGLDIQKTFLLTTLVWVALSVFAAIPFIGIYQCKPGGCNLRSSFRYNYNRFYCIQ